MSDFVIRVRKLGGNQLDQQAIKAHKANTIEINRSYSSVTYNLKK